MKIWDSRNFHCVQTFLSVAEISGFASCGSHHRRLIVPEFRTILCYGKLCFRRSDVIVHPFCSLIVDQDGGPYKMSTGQAPISVVLFSSVTFTFATAAEREVKVLSFLETLDV